MTPNRRGSTAESLRAELLTAKDLRQLPAPEWLLADILLRDSTALLYGKPGTAKSFLALDWALSIATGSWWFKREVTAGQVVYCAGEGVTGLAQRIDAWKDSRMFYDEPEGFDVLPRVVNLLDDQEVPKLCAMLADLEPRLVVIDTLARATVGAEENSAKDMGRAIHNLDQIRRATGACVLMVHHNNRAGSNPRGSSALDGAVETVIEVSREGSTIRLKNPKQKDALEFTDVLLTLSPHLKSAVLSRYSPDGGDLNADALTVLRMLEEIADEEGVTASVWGQVTANSGVAVRTFYRAKKHLLELGLTASDKDGRGARFTLTDLGRQRLDD